jgi:hypothetical protein
MGARRRDVFCRCVHAGHLRAQPGQRFAQQPRAAADVDRALASERTHAARIGGPVRSMASRMKPSLTGFSLCSMAEEPLGFHQSAASFPKCSASAMRIVSMLLVALLMIPF